MKLTGVVMVAALTARSQAYVQALLQRGFRLDAIVMFGRSGLVQPGQGGARNTSGWHETIFIPDLSVPLRVSCAMLAEQVEFCDAASINETPVLETLRRLDARLIIYSGYGGQIVGAPLLALGPRFLHMHAGWLPQYRGSTTIYYSLLQEGRCGVSAILLGCEIDVGEIVLQEWYPAPPPLLDIDYVYDSAVRADLLVKAMGRWMELHDFAGIREQSVAEGETYYVIHPLLKHVAIMALDARD